MRIQSKWAISTTMLKKLLAILSIQLLAINICIASTDEFQRVKIADPYIEMSTGPGSGYPVFHVIERGELVDIILQRANWYKIKSQKGLQGWVPFQQLSKTLSPNDEAIQFITQMHDDFSQRNWEWGVLGGEFGGAPVFTAYGSYLFNKNFATEASFSQSIGDSSSSLIYKIGIFMQPFPEWKYSPFFHMGTGIINVKPASNLVQPVDQSNQFSNVTIGLRSHLTQRIILRIEYNNYVIFSATKDNDNNEDISEWKAGFAIFF